MRSTPRRVALVCVLILCGWLLPGVAAACGMSCQTVAPNCRRCLEDPFSISNCFNIGACGCHPSACTAPASEAVSKPLQAELFEPVSKPTCSSTVEEAPALLTAE